MIRGMKKSEEILAENLRLMILEQGITQQEVADRSKGKISLRHVQRIAGLAGGVSLEKVDAIARALKVEPWELIMPGYQPKDAKDPRFRKLIEAWLRATDDSKDFIARFADRETNKN